MERAAHPSATADGTDCVQVRFEFKSKLESLLEFLVLEKHARVSLLEKDESHLFYLVVRGQELLNGGGGNSGRFGLWIPKSSG